MASPGRVSREPPQQRRAEDLSSGGFLLAALLTCAFGVGVVVAGYFWLKAPAPQMSEAVLSATGRSEPVAAPPPVDNGAWTDDDIKDCNNRATAAADAAKQRRLAAVSQDRVGLGGPDAEVVQRATYLLCGSTRKPLHLCESYWRDWYMQAIRRHAADFKEISTTAYWTKVSLADRARKAAGNGADWQAISDDLDQTTRELGKMHDDITAAFRSLIADGIVDPADFGVFLGMGIPPDIAAMIGDARAERHLCG